VCVFSCLCTGRGLATSWSPVQGVLRSVLDLVTQAKRKVSSKFGCRAKGKKKIMCYGIVCIAPYSLPSSWTDWDLRHSWCSGRTRTAHETSCTLQLDLISDSVFSPLPPPPPPLPPECVQRLNRCSDSPVCSHLNLQWNSSTYTAWPKRNCNGDSDNCYIPPTQTFVSSPFYPLHAFMYLFLRGFSPQANHTDRATAACRRS
jgi:hypothetical protein